MTIKIRMKMLESKLDNGLLRLCELKESGIPRTKLHSFYRQELELEGNLIDYILLAHHVKENKIKYYVASVKELVK
ncbi:MAG TPA: hypothetical protein VI911_07395 [Patescibacteria group bacterium]|nr:hypothetical protein [Patescibacteria group bacterium]